MKLPPELADLKVSSSDAIRYITSVQRKAEAPMVSQPHIHDRIGGICNAISTALNYGGEFLVINAVAFYVEKETNIKKMYVSKNVGPFDERHGRIGKPGEAKVDISGIKGSQLLQKEHTFNPG